MKAISAETYQYYVDRLTTIDQSLQSRITEFFQSLEVQASTKASEIKNLISELNISVNDVSSVYITNINSASSEVANSIDKTKNILHKQLKDIASEFGADITEAIDSLKGTMQKEYSTTINYAKADIASELRQSLSIIQKGTELAKHDMLNTQKLLYSEFEQKISAKLEEYTSEQAKQKTIQLQIINYAVLAGIFITGLLTVEYLLH